MNIEVANRLQKLRKEKGYSQEQLAEALGISRQAVSKWERAEASPDTDNLILLARLYGISLDELLSTDDNNEELKTNNMDKENSKEETKKSDNVNISTQGIDVEDKDGTKVHVGWDGIRIFDSKTDDHINISPKGIKIINDNEPRSLRIAKELCGGLAALGTTLAFILLGCFADLWHPGWIVFLLIPIITSLPNVIYKRKLSMLPYPVIVVIAYLLIGFLADGWHPYWFLFITIPIYYVIVDPIDKLIARDKDNIKINGENVSDVNLSDLEGKEFKIEADGKEIIINAKEN